MNSFKMDSREMREKTLWMNKEDLGFYLEIIWFYYSNEQGISENLDDIFDVLKAKSKNEKAIIEKILLKNFKKIDGRYIDEEIEKDIKKRKKNAEKNRINGSLGGNISSIKKREKLAS